MSEMKWLLQELLAFNISRFSYHVEQMDSNAIYLPVNNSWVQKTHHVQQNVGVLPLSLFCF